MENKLAIFLCFLCAVSCNAMAEGVVTLTKDDIIKLVNEAIIENKQSPEKKEQLKEEKDKEDIIHKYFGDKIKELDSSS